MNGKNWNRKVLGKNRRMMCDVISIEGGFEAVSREFFFRVAENNDDRLCDYILKYRL